MRTYDGPFCVTWCSRGRAAGGAVTAGRAGNVGLGLGYRLGRLGLRAEGRNMMYKFDRFGYSKTQNDLLWQAGLTLQI